MEKKRFSGNTRKTKQTQEQSLADTFARSMTTFFRFFADTFFAKRYGHRAVVLETIAAVPGMVAGVHLHFKSLRNMKTGYGFAIREMLAEAENERMHLMFFIAIAKPNLFERFLVVLAQLIFMSFYFVLYMISFQTAHRMIGYFEDEAVRSYTDYLDLIYKGEIENIYAPNLAVSYYNLKPGAKLSDMITRVRDDEMKHAKVNHRYADKAKEIKTWRIAKR